MSITKAVLSRSRQQVEDLSASDKVHLNARENEVIEFPNGASNIFQRVAAILQSSSDDIDLDFYVPIQEQRRVRMMNQLRLRLVSRGLKGKDTWFSRDVK